MGRKGAKTLIRLFCPGRQNKSVSWSQRFWNSVYSNFFPLPALPLLVLLMIFHYLLETKTPHREVVIPFLDFPALNRRKRTKISFILKLTKGWFTSCTKANNHFNCKSWVPGLFALNSALRDLCLHDSHCQIYHKSAYGRKAYTHTIVLDASIMNKQQKNSSFKLMV